MEKKRELTRVGVYYDGAYFQTISHYYYKVHEKKSRLNVGGVHNLIRRLVAQKEATDIPLCQIVDAHYFRGRFPANEAKNRENSLYVERVIDDLFNTEGVDTHYLPLHPKTGGGKQEKGIDVWLALEAFEQAFYKKFDVLVLVASDGDFIPLVRKLNSLGIRVMLLSWEYTYTFKGDMVTQKTSQTLLKEVTYPVEMHTMIDSMLRSKDDSINELFYTKSNNE